MTLWIRQGCLSLIKGIFLIFNGNMIIRVKMNELMEPRDLDKH
jgi:hypothetical protein